MLATTSIASHFIRYCCSITLNNCAYRESPPIDAMFPPLNCPRNVEWHLTESDASHQWSCGTHSHWQCTQNPCPPHLRSPDKCDSLFHPGSSQATGILYLLPSTTSSADLPQKILVQQYLHGDKVPLWHTPSYCSFQFHSLDLRLVLFLPFFLLFLADVDDAAADRGCAEDDAAASCDDRRQSRHHKDRVSEVNEECPNELYRHLASATTK